MKEATGHRKKRQTCGAFLTGHWFPKMGAGYPKMVGLPSRNECFRGLECVDDLLLVLKVGNGGNDL